MKLFGWRWLAVSSLLLGALAASAETRPQYGGTLRIAMRAAPTSLDPADRTQPDSFARRTLTSLLFETLVTADESGRTKAALAESWQPSRANQRWQFRLRRGVTFHDGTPLTAEAAAASLRVANPSWTVSAEADTVIVELGASDPELPAKLALPRNAVVKRDSDGKLSGTGPFRIVDWQPRKKLTLAADENCWRGRPFLDSIEIALGKDSREQMTALELGRADLIEVMPEQGQRVTQTKGRVASSVPIELLVLLFSRDVSSPAEEMLRQALALSVERASIRSVLLQRSGEGTAGILPTWMSGYGFVFPADADLAKARQLRDQARTVPTWTIGYDSGDPLARLLAERIALNARDAGLALQPAASATADLRVVRIPLASLDPWVALEDFVARAGLPMAASKGGSAEELYASELAVLASVRVIPLFHLPASYASASNLKNWKLRLDGSLDLEDAWLENAKP